jgi:Mce-associated membrane protein
MTVTADTTTDVVDDDDAATPEVTPEAAETVQPTRWRRRLLVGLTILVVAASLALSGVLGWMLWQDRQVAEAGQQAQEAAVSYAQVLTSIDSNKVDENFQQVLDGATGEFRDMYSQSSVQLRQLLIDNKAAAHGVVVDSAVQSESRNTVVVLLFVDQSVSNTNVPDARIDRSRIKMTMELVDGRWRASKVELP